MAKQKGNNWKGIPARARKGVRALRKLTGRKDSPQKVWREMVAHQKAMEQKRRDEEQRKAAEAEQLAGFKLQSAKNDVDDCMSHMTTVRDMLGHMAEGELYGFPTEELAYFLRVGVVDSMSKMEDALVQLGILKKDAEFFVERPFAQKEEQAV